MSKKNLDKLRHLLLSAGYRLLCRTGKLIERCAGDDSTDPVALAAATREYQALKGRFLLVMGSIKG